MRVLFALAQTNPWRSLAALGCLLIAALAEGIGLSSLLPLFSLAIGTGLEIDSPLHGSGADGQSWLKDQVHALLSELNISPSIDLLCFIVLRGIVLKASFVLLAQRQIGYAVARVATDLRLALLRVLLAVRWEYYIRQPVGRLANAFATAALDPHTEAAIWQTIRQLRNEMTILAITHEPTLLESADSVYRIEDGHFRAVTLSSNVQSSVPSLS